MKLSVIVTTYNRPRALEKVLCALGHQTRSADEVIVADDGSDRDTAHVIERIGSTAGFFPVHVWQPDQGFRAARIRNAAVRRSSGDYIVFLDGDCIPNRHFVADHLRLARTGCFFQGKRVLVSRSATRLFAWPHANAPVTLFKLMLSGGLGNGHHLLRMAWLPSWTSPGLSGTRSCNLGMFRTDLYAVNGFNEAFEGWGREDSELVARLYAFGLKRRIHPFLAICFHLWHDENSRHRLAHNDALLRKVCSENAYFTPEGLDRTS